MTSRIRILLLLATSATIATSLLAPASASAILVGAESNGELVNSNRTPALQAVALDKMQRQGVQVVRGNWGWNEVALPGCEGQTLAQLEDPTNSCYHWTLFDSFVRQANDRGMQVLISITRNPTWVTNHPDRMWMGATDAQFEHVMNHYVAFHKAAATRYAAGSPYGTIRFWSVHNEPNSSNYWKPAANAQRYARLYAATAKAIKGAYPGATVAPGPTNPLANNGIKPMRFIRQFQSHIGTYLPGTQARTYINAWAHNPYPGITTQPSTPSTVAHPESIGMANIQRLFTTLDSHPSTRGVKVWATEFGWETSGNFRVTESRQAQFIAEAFDWLDAKRRVTIGISYGLTDPTDPVDWQSGTYTAAGKAKQSVAMFRRMVSVPQAGLGNKVRRGTMVNVWGRSNINKATGVLAYQQTGSSVWRLVPGQRRAADGSIRARFRATARQVRFAVYDKGNPAFGIAAGYGPVRLFSTY